MQVLNLQVGVSTSPPVCFSMYSVLPHCVAAERTELLLQLLDIHRGGLLDPCLPWNGDGGRHGGGGDDGVA